MNRMKINRILSLMTGLLVLSAPLALAASATKVHDVTVTKPSVISITADKTNFDLVFSDFITNSLSDTEVVTYTVKANGMGTTGKMSGKLDATFTGVDLLATVGSYTQLGSTGAKVLTPVSGEKTITTTDVTLATPDAAGKIYGSIPVTYKAKATADLASGNETKQLTVTLADA